MKMVVVDDEIFTLQLFRKMDWDALGIQIVGFCRNGKEALECIQKEKPDILITDIKIPVIDGLELIQSLRNQNNNIKVIILSAYREFEYVQKALSYKVVGYILKPVDEIQLVNIVNETIQEIKKESTQKQNNLKTKTIVQEKMLKQLLHYQKTGTAIHGIISNLQMDIHITDYQLLNITIDNYTYEQHFNFDEYPKSLSQKILDDLNSINELAKHSIIFENEPGEWIIILDTTFDLDTEKITHNILRLFKNTIHINCFISISDICHDISTLNYAYAQTTHLMRYRFYLPDADIISSSFEKGFQVEEIKFVEQEKIVMNYLRVGNISSAIDFINSLFKNINANPVLDPERLYMFVYELLISIKLEIFKNEMDGSLPEKLMNIKPEDLKEYNTLDRLQNFFITLIKEMTKNIPHQKPESNYLISKAKEYIDLHHNENINLNEICQYVSVSKHYFCYLFKRETNESIWNYLTRIRIKKSKDMLLNSTYRNYEIAYKVGYQNPSYFTKIFKKYTGLTPQDYRSMYI